MKRFAIPLLAAAGLMVLAPAGAEAQVDVQLRVHWTWGDDGWRPYEQTYPTRAPVYVPPPRAVPVRYRSFRVPPGHLPPPGACRLWYVGRPPGHQPPPQSCRSLLLGPGVPGAVIIGGPAPQDRYYGGSGWEERGSRWEERGPEWGQRGPRYKEPPGRGRGRANRARARGGRGR